MNTKSLLLVGLLSVVPALVVACDCGCQATVAEQETQAVEETTKKVVKAEEATEVVATEVVAEATPAQ